MDKEVKIHKVLSRAYYIRNQLKKRANQEPSKIIEGRLSNLNKRIKNLKDSLRDEFKKNKGILRTLPEDVVIDKKIISVFDSVLTRTLNMKINQINDEIIVVQTYFFDILKELIFNGFVFKGEKYICFTASAGQIRTKKTVFIKEKIYEQHKNSLMCGLTPERINSLNGVNINKYLAYLALCNSATDEWFFDLDRSIVVDDMELTLKDTVVDFIDENTFEISRCKKDVVINHTDGCGMILPQLSKKNFMIRMPWIKGLLVSFPFDKYIKEHNCSPVIKDIYGKEYNIIKDNIQIIFTKSQFKMWKYYSSWDEYKSLFRLHNSRIGICNEEEDELDDKRLNYQMLQTLIDITDKEIKQITKKTNEKIANLSHDRKTMLKVFGVSKNRQDLNSFQRALLLYPELLKDEYTKHTIQQIKRKLVREGKAGKVDVESKYAFVCPDLYAFCEYLFSGKENPSGLLNEGEVSFSEYENERELDCLRSPHLYMEHAIRKNVLNEKTRKWFITKGIYVSIHDPISKILMFDNDGDKLLVVADESIVKVAKRNIEKYDIVPLHYNMRKADNHMITKEMIYSGLVTAYTGGNIGIISNDITKIWNNDEINLDAIKRLCAFNNFVIDYAKTLYKPEIPERYKKDISDYIKQKLPHFFIYAKQKSESNVAPTNNSTMNRIAKSVIDKRLIIKKINVGDFDYRMLMNDPSLTSYEDELIKKYVSLDKQNAYEGVNSIHKKTTKDNVKEYLDIRKEMEEYCISREIDIQEAVDHFILYLFRERKSKFKTTFWSSFGDIVVSNIQNNLKRLGLEKSIVCDTCGKRIKKTSNRTKYCNDCWKLKQKQWQKESMRKLRSK
jgi:hypothetical protein